MEAVGEWRARRTQLVWIVAAVFALGLAVALVSLQLTGDGDGADRRPSPTVEQGGVVKADVEVAVLNATAVPGLAAKVGDDVETNGYALGAVTNSDVPAEDSQVLFERGHEEEARRRGQRPRRHPVEPIDSDVERPRRWRRRRRDRRRGPGAAVARMNQNTHLPVASQSGASRPCSAPA